MKNYVVTVLSLSLLLVLPACKQPKTAVEPAPVKTQIEAEEVVVTSEVVEENTETVTLGKF